MPVTVLAALSAIAYATMIVQIARRRARFYAGLRAFNVLALVFFAVSRLAPQSALAGIAATLAIAVSLVAVSRRATVFGAIFAGIPLLVMLLTVDRIFFTGEVAQAFQSATVALLCSAGPLGVLYFTTTRNQSVP